jgi:antitoxin CptB
MRTGSLFCWRRQDYTTLSGPPRRAGGTRVAQPAAKSRACMTDDVESRRRRAAFRATRRGTKEMDWLIGRFADARLSAMPPDELAQFERLLALPDPQLHDMILYPDVAPAGVFARLVAEMRAFHGLS